MAPRKDPDSDKIRIGNQVLSYRAALMLLVLLSTPLGQPIWRLMNLTTLPDNTAAAVDRIERRLSKLESQIEDVNGDIRHISTQITTLGTDFTAYKAAHL